jgi:hypothetical protein
MLENIVRCLAMLVDTLWRVAEAGNKLWHGQLGLVICLVCSDKHTGLSQRTKALSLHSLAEHEQSSAGPLR